MLEPLFVSHTETLLFVDDHQSKVVELDVLGEQAMRADHDVGLASFSGHNNLLLLLRWNKPAQHGDCHRKSCKSLLERFVVLIAEDGRRRQHGDLLTVRNGFERRAHRNFGFAVSDVATYKAVHWHGRFHVPLDIRDGR